jgi:hypothetical protein
MAEFWNPTGHHPRARHGTVMAAIAAGVPLVCVPMGRDQPAVALVFRSFC